MSLKTENSRRVAKSRPVCMGLKFFDRIEIFFCLTSTQMELNRNLLNLNNRNFGSIEKFRLVENRLYKLSAETNRQLAC